MKMATKTTFFQSSKVQLFSIIFAIAYLVCFLFWQGANTPSIDHIRKPLSIDRKIASTAAQVEVGLEINNFPEFSFEHGPFVMDCVIWFKFEKGTESLKTIESFTIANAVENNSGSLILLSSPMIKAIGDHILVSYNVLVKFVASPNHKNFPIGNHTLAIVVQNKNVTPYELNFASSNQNIVINKENMEISWDPIRAEVETGYFSTTLTNPANEELEIQYPVASFVIEFENIGVRDLVSLYFPQLLIFFIILFCLLLDITDISRLSYVATAVPILVLFRMVIDGVSPTVGYNTHVDYFFYLLVVLSLVILLFQIYVVLTLHRGKKETEEQQKITAERIDYLNSLVLMGVLIILIVVTTLSHWR